MARQPSHRGRRRRLNALSASAAAVLAVAAVAAASLPQGAAAVTCDKTLKGTPANQDAVVVWEKTCNEARNWECKEACDLWNNVSRGASGSYVYSGGKPYRGKILPTVPVTGIESIALGKSYDAADQATYKLWKQALGDVTQSGKIQGVTQPSKTPVIYLNSLAARTRHQFHAHVGQPQNDTFFKCASAIINTPPPPPNPALSWSKPVSGGACEGLKAGGNSQVSLIATTVGPNDVNRAIRSGLKYEMKVGDITQNATGIRTGVLAMPIKNSANLLVFLVTGTNDYRVFGDKP